MTLEHVKGRRHYIRVWRPGGTPYAEVTEPIGTLPRIAGGSATNMALFHLEQGLGRPPAFERVVVEVVFGHTQVTATAYELPPAEEEEP